MHTSHASFVILSDTNTYHIYEYQHDFDSFNSKKWDNITISFNFGYKTLILNTFSELPSARSN